MKTASTFLQTAALSAVFLVHGFSGTPISGVRRALQTMANPSLQATVPAAEIQCFDCA
jgi:esterase/lipase